MLFGLQSRWRIAPDGPQGSGSAEFCKQRATDMLCVLVQVFGERLSRSWKDGYPRRSQRGSSKKWRHRYLSQRLCRTSCHNPFQNGHLMLSFYQLSNILLIKGILEGLDDLDLRIHHRSQMEAAGLQQILTLCRNFGVPQMGERLDDLQGIFEDDEKKLKERLDQEILRDLKNPEDVYNALRAKTQDSKAGDYFLSMMQHMLLIREEGTALAHYYQLIDSIVTDVVLDKKLVGAEQRFGYSVERIIAQFNETDRLQHVEEELSRTQASLLRVRLEKETLEEEIAQGGDGLVGSLKTKVSRLEEKLQVSRENTSKLQNQLESQKAGYEEQIAQLEAQIMELFRMLKDVGKGVHEIIDNAGAMDRKTLIETLEKHFQRDKTISILEGRKHDRRRGEHAGIAEEDANDLEDGHAASSKAGDTKYPPSSYRKGPKSPQTTREAEAQNGRTSQFMDADDAMVQEQIQQQLSEGAMVRHMSGSYHNCDSIMAHISI